jgi:PilZ domain
MNDPKKPERRVAVRWSSSQQAPCHFATLERITARWADVLNVSSHGIGLLLPCDLEPGRELIVELPCKDPSHPGAVIAHVVHAERHSSPGHWAVGCTFARPLTQEELDILR